MDSHNILAKKIIDSAFQVHKCLGPGLLETVYEIALTHEIEKRGLKVDRQKLIPITYDEIQIDQGFRADIIVDEKVIVELKSIEKVAPVHKKQLLTYLRLANMRLGLLINFGENLLKTGISRVVNGL